MDLLKNIVDQVKQTELQKKRKLLAVDANASSSTDDAAPPPAKKYLRRGDLERLREEEYLRRQQQKEAERARRHAASTPTSTHSGSTATPTRRHRDGHDHDDDDDDEAAAIDAMLQQLSADEVNRRLRARGHPIRLFGESDRDRVWRMRRIEAEALDEGKGQRNEYAQQLARTEAGLQLEMLQRERSGGASDTGSRSGAAATKSDTASSAAPRAAGETAEGVYKPEYDVTKLHASLLATDPDACFVLVYVCLRRMLDTWEAILAARPDHVKRSTAGKHEATKFAQAKDNLKPFFKLLKRKAVETDVMAKIADILRYVQQREYVKAYDAYLQLSIGNAPWPIGVTMVGIHERSAREKIFASQVAHVLNDETQRKWIQSIKRIMSFFQLHFPPDDPTKMFG
ncbi:mRNA splicing protein prp18 [Allomyces arbusculus]|nr:mRNA splicing protein prp18 [Allomyces arbusculus]